MTRRKGTAIFIVIVIVISSLLFGCTKQKLEPMTNIWVSPCYIPGCSAAGIVPLPSAGCASLQIWSTMSMPDVT